MDRITASKSLLKHFNIIIEDEALSHNFYKEILLYLKRAQMRDEFKNSQNWYRRYLPHYDASDKIQFITYRLADSLPQKVLVGMKEFCENENCSEKGLNLKYKVLVEKYLDSGYSSCLLKRKTNAQIVIDNWLHFHKKSYELLAFVVMY